jgi:hypothetical protein
LVLDQIVDLFRTTHKVKTQQVTRSRGPGSVMWGHRVNWLPHERSGVFGTGSAHHPRKIRK